MKSIILLNFCNGMYGGIESFLLNAFYCLDKDKYDVTFLTCGRSTYNMFRNDIISKKGHIEEIPILANNYKKKIMLFYELRKYFRKKKPDIVHINSGTLSLQFLASKAAKLEDIKKIILHSHNFLFNKTGIKEKLKEIIKIQLCKNGNFFLACSTGAALWMFPRKIVMQGKVIIIPNGIDTKKFLFNEKKRNCFRKNLNLNKELLIGNIGRFQGQKNHEFMVKIMSEVRKLNPDAKLLLVGEGILKKDIQKLVQDNHLQNNVIFLGERKDTDAFLSAIDIFIFPSIYEGFGISAIEAEASGALVILSHAVPKETNVSGDAIYLPIENLGDERLWAEEICKERSKVDRIEINQKIFNAGYDINLSYQKVIDIYGEESLNVNNK